MGEILWFLKYYARSNTNKMMAKRNDNLSSNIRLLLPPAHKSLFTSESGPFQSTKMIGSKMSISTDQKRPTTCTMQLHHIFKILDRKFSSFSKCSMIKLKGAILYDNFLILIKSKEEKTTGGQVCRTAVHKNHAAHLPWIFKFLNY